MHPLIVLFIAYLVGSIPFGFIAGKAKGVDIRAHGSGNIGATNTLRLLGTGAGLAVLVLDILKGAGAASLGFWAGGPWLGVGAGLLAVTGHNWSVFLGFRGGKGVATSFGFAVYLMPLPSAIGLGAFLLVVAITRFVSLGSLVGGLALAIAAAATRQPVPYLLVVVLAVAGLFIRHRDNIARLRSGTENRLSFGPRSRGREGEER